MNGDVELRREEKAAEQMEAARQLSARGVTITRPETCVIDAGVEVGSGTVIEPYVQLLGKTRVGSGCLIRSFTVVEDCDSGERSDDPAELRAGREYSGELEPGSGHSRICGRGAKSAKKPMWGILSRPRRRG